MQISLKIPSIVSVAGCLGYDVLENGTSSGTAHHNLNNQQLKLSKSSSLFSEAVTSTS
jgi:hypothetical protein